MANSTSQLENFFTPFRKPVTERRWTKACSSRPETFMDPAGYWQIRCDTTIRDDDGLTELDRVWSAAKYLVAEEIFVQATYRNDPPWAESTPVIKTVNCYVRDYKDVEDVLKSAVEFRKKVYFPYPLYMRTERPLANGKTETNPIYFCCFDGELYEPSVKGYKIVNN